MSESTYDKQHRGDQNKYTQYYAGMDKSMAQKIALVSSHLTLHGIIADMGSGSGKGSADLAALFPQLQVVGIDISSESVEYSQTTHQAPNLSFKQGDIAQKLYGQEHFEAIINSSVLHHVTSFNDFDIQRIYTLLDNQVAELKQGGSLSIRDFVAPEENEDILIELPSDDGLVSGSPEDVSTSQLFEIFCRDFRCAKYPKGELPYELVEARSHTKVYKINNRLATEFMLRKDYRDNWSAEILEEYLYFTQAEFERELLRRNLRILLSRPIYNQWIIRNRWQNKVCLYSLDKTSLNFPPTNYIIIGRKISAKEGVIIKEKYSDVAEPRFLKLMHFKHKDSGHQWDVIARPGETFDLVPWFKRDNELYILARDEYPRPITRVRGLDIPPDSVFISGYIPEPISLMQPDETTVSGSPKQTITDFLILHAKLSQQTVQTISDGPKFYPSPGATAERVNTQFVAIKAPKMGFDKKVQYANISAHQIKEYNANQLLRAYKVGGMVDVRLEIAVYELLQILGEPLTPWIEQKVRAPAERALVPANWPKINKSLMQNKFSVMLAQKPSYMTVRRGSFSEYTSQNEELRAWELEYIVPQERSTNTVTLLPLARWQGHWFVGLEVQHFAPVQALAGYSGVLTVPAWRLPRHLNGSNSILDFLRAKIEIDFDLRLEDILPLGGSYYPSPGTSPEYVTPFVATVMTEMSERLHWFKLDDLLKHREELKDGHLRISFWRAWHMLLDTK